MTQNSTPAEIPFTLVTPVTAAQVAAAPLLRTQVVTPDGRTVLPLGKLNWALHNTWDGDTEGFAAWLNEQA